MKVAETYESYVPPATKLRQGNVFTPVGHSVHRGVSVPACTTGHMTGGGLCPGKGGLSLLLGRPPMYGNERAVRILPECILVSKSVSAV